MNALPLLLLLALLMPYSVRRQSGRSPLTVVATEPAFQAGDTDLLAAVSADGSFTSTANWALVGTGGGVIAAQGAGTGRLGGSTQAIRCTWPATDEALCGIGTPQWSAATHVYCTYWVKVVSGYFADQAGCSGIKWLLFRRNPDSGDLPNGTYGRITWGLNSLTGVSPATLDGTSDGGFAFTCGDLGSNGGFIQNMGSFSPGWTTPSKVRSPNVCDGAWHRYTNEADTLNNVMRLWIDGTKVIEGSGFGLAMNDAGFKNMEWGQNVVASGATLVETILDYSDFSAWSRP